MRLLALVFAAVMAWAQPLGFGNVLRVEVAPVEAVHPGTAVQVNLTLDIQPGWHVNAHTPSLQFLIPTTLALTLPPGFRVVEEHWPTPGTRTLGFSRTPLELYEGLVEVTLWIEVGGEVPPGNYVVHGQVQYQACNDEACAPPATVDVEIPISVSAGVAGSSSSLPRAGALFARGFLWSLGAAFVVGLGLNLTPCVYPMVPVTVAYFAKMTGETFIHTLGLASTYLLGIAIAYSALGSLAALGGSLLGQALQHPAVLGFLAAVMVGLALSFFGVYTVRAPARLTRRLPQGKKGVLGTFLMGAVVGVVAAPCVGPATVAFISYVASLGDPLKGFFLFFALALGLGIPYVGLALLSGRLRRLPKPGPWTVWVEHLLGFGLLGMALYLISPLLPDVGLRVGIAVLAVGGGIFLLFSGLRRRSRLITGFSVVVALAGIGMGVWRLVPTAEPEALWVQYSPEVLAQAWEEGKPVVLYFSADWCLPCQELSASTFQDAQVRKVLSGVVSVKVDLTKPAEEEEAVRRRFGVIGVPTVLFLGPKGEERGRLFGYVDAPTFLASFRKAYESTG